MPFRPGSCFSIAAWFEPFSFFGPAERRSLDATSPEPNQEEDEP